MRQAQLFGTTVMLVCITLFACHALRKNQHTEPIYYTALWTQLALDTVTNEYDETAKVLVQSRAYPIVNASIAHVSRSPCRSDRCEILQTAIEQLQYAETRSITKQPWRWHAYPAAELMEQNSEVSVSIPKRARYGSTNVPVLSAVVFDVNGNPRPLYSKADFLNSALIRPWWSCCIRTSLQTK